jgi:WD40 repeat protein
VTKARAFTWKWRQSQPQWLGDRIYDYSINSIQFDPAGRRIVLTGDKYVDVLDLRGNLKSTNVAARDAVNKASISPDGRLIAAAGNDGEGIVGYANRANYRPLLGLSGHGAALNDVSFSAPGDRIATAGADGTVRVWRVPRANRIWGGQWAPWALGARFTPDGREVVFVLASGEVRFADAATGAVDWQSTVKDGGPIESSDVSPDGKAIVLGDQRLIPFVLRRDGREVPVFQEPETPYVLTRLRWSPQTALPLIAAGNRNNEVVAWNAGRGGPPVWTASLGLPFNRVVDLEFSADARKLVTVSTDGRLRVLRPTLKDPRVADTRTMTVGASTDVAVSSDGRFAATAGEDQSVRIWDLQKPDGEPLHVFADPTGTIAEVAFSRDAHSQWVAAVGADGFTYVWDRETGFLRAAVRRHGDYVNAVDFDPDDPTRLVTASDDGSAAVYSCSPCDLDADELAAAARKQLPDLRVASVKPETRETQASAD